MSIRYIIVLTYILYTYMHIRAKIPNNYVFGKENDFFQVVFCRAGEIIRYSMVE
jgi:hypothetical protein